MEMETATDGRTTGDRRRRRRRLARRRCRCRLGFILVYRNLLTRREVEVRSRGKCGHVWAARRRDYVADALASASAAGRRQKFAAKSTSRTPTQMSLLSSPWGFFSSADPKCIDLRHPFSLIIAQNCYLQELNKY